MMVKKLLFACKDTLALLTVAFWIAGGCVCAKGIYVVQGMDYTHFLTEEVLGFVQYV